MKNSPITNLRVGIFVTVALIIAAASAFTIGDRRGLFRRKSTFTALFHNVAGLRPGSSLRIAGVDSGTVGDVKLNGDGTIVVTLNVANDALPLIRTDSIVTIGSKGLLGDKLVDISVGTGAAVAAGSRLRSEEPMDLASIATRAGDIVQSAQATVNNLRDATGVLADDRFASDLKDTVHGVSEVMRMVAEGDGVAHRLLADGEMAARVDRTLANAEHVSASFAQVAENARAISNEIRTGDGSAHALIYGNEGTTLVRNAGSLAGEMTQALSSIRTGDGTLHDLIYTDRAGVLVDNANQMSTDLRAIVADIRAGRGTIGGFVTDPSVYEDVKRLVGNLERNEILRALVRYSIRHDEDPPRATVEATNAPSPTGR